MSSTHGESQVTEKSDSTVDRLQFSVDVVSAARKNVGFLSFVSQAQWLHRKSTLREAIRRYDELWMPLISDLTLGFTAPPPMIVPPFDIEWVWFCHTLNPVCYKEYCYSKFSKLIGKPAIFDEENKGYALMRCRDIWITKYPSEPFENQNESDSDFSYPFDSSKEKLFRLVSRQGWLHSKFIEPYMSEIVYLIAARQRYQDFLSLVKKFGDGCSCFVPTSDVLLMWLTHQSYPTVYAGDMNHMEMEINQVTGIGDTVDKSAVEETKKLWERTFDHPYHKAGSESAMKLDRLMFKRPFYWEIVDNDVNTKYKSMVPRFLLEVCIFVRLNSSLINGTKLRMSRDFMRAKVVRCYKELKIDRPISSFPLDTWEKACHFYCEFGTRGVVMELRSQGSQWFKGSNLQDSYRFHWNDLLRSSSLTMGRELDRQLRVVTSITPPVQAPYLLKCVSDRVTDDSGAMLSDVILKMNNYRPQEGRWLSRTVLDHAGKECFVIRMRVGGGFWRRGGETPFPVKWEERITEIRAGPWSYIGGSIGRVPVKVVGTATPKEPSEQWNASWCFSTGDELMIKWGSSPLLSGLIFQLNGQSSPHSSLKLLKGRKMQYRVKKVTPESGNGETQLKQNHYEEEEEEDNDDEEEGFLTLVRFTEDNPVGRATALLNWKLLVIELLPEEDVVFILLLCISILRTSSEMRKEDIGNLLIRRRSKEAKLGARDWGSVILHPSSYSSTKYSLYVQPWYWNAKVVMAPTEGSTDGITRQTGSSHSPAEGGDKLYKRCIITNVRE